MHISTQEFPRVWFSNIAPSNWRQELEALLAKDQRFVLLTRELPGADEEQAKAQEEFTQWVKENHRNFRKSCAGCVVVVNNALLAFSIGFFVAPLSKKLGIPVLVAQEDDLDEQVATCLAANTTTENS